MKAPISLEPGYHLRMFMRGIDVDNQVDIKNDRSDMEVRTYTTELGNRLLLESFQLDYVPERVMLHELQESGASTGVMAAKLLGWMRIRELLQTLDRLVEET